MVPAELLRRVRRIQIRSTALATDLFAGQYHSAFKGRGIEFDEVREYQPGDDVRSLDWNVTARTGRPYVKSFREERELTFMLMVDVSASQSFGSHVQLKRELVTEIAATLAFSALQNNDKVGLVQFSSNIEQFVPPRKGRRHVLRIIRELLSYPSQRLGTDLSVALDFTARVLRRRAVVFLISDFLAPDFASTLRLLARRHDLVSLCVTDRLEHQLPNAGFLRAIDSETGETVELNTNSRSRRRRYAERAGRRRATLERTMRQLRLDLITVETGGSYIAPLQHFFAKRRHRLAKQ